jgi:hypothetical protein
MCFMRFNRRCGFDWSMGVVDMSVYCVALDELWKDGQDEQDQRNGHGPPSAASRHCRDSGLGQWRRQL